MAGRKPKNPEDRKRYTGKSISEFCQKVRERRIQLGVTQAELAARTGYSRKQISELEGGAFPTSEERILALCSALETTPDYLFGFIPPATKRLGQGVLMDDITHAIAELNGREL